MAYVKRFKKGGKINSIREACDLIITKKEFVYYRHKPYHPGWAQGWSLQFLDRAIYEGELFRNIELRPAPA